MSCPGCPAPSHEHPEGMNECWICDAPVPCANCGHTALHTNRGCWGERTTDGNMACKCREYVRPTCDDCRASPGTDTTGVADVVS